MSNRVYFGTRAGLRLVKAPAINTPLTKVGWSHSGTDLNGGGFAINSPSSHREYELVWGASPAKDIYEVLDLRLGDYTGGGYIYYLDPFAMKTNVLSETFSSPFAMSSSGLFGASSPPTVIGDSYVFPSAVEVTYAGESKSMSLVIPAGHAFYYCYGISTPESSCYLKVGNLSQGTGTPFTATDLSWNKVGPYSIDFAVDIRYVAPVDGSIAFGSMAVILPDGETPVSRRKWEPGRGSSGLKFKGEPQVTGISAVYGGQGGLLNASATLIETELWEQS